MTDIQACQVLLDRLLSGISVSAADVYKALDSEHKARLKNRLMSLRDLRATFKDARQELRDYTRLLQIADMLDGRAENLSSTYHRRSVKKLAAGRQRGTSGHSKLYDKVESAYEHAIERLSEVVSANPLLANFLDIHFDPNTKAGIEEYSTSKGGMPRVRFDISSNDDAKREALRSAIEDANKPKVENALTNEQSEKLKSMLKQLTRK